MATVDEYLETQVLTASPWRLHLLTIDGAIRFARQAEAAMAAERWDQMFLLLDRSRGLVGEMIAGLNPDAASELVEQQKSLFVFVFRSLALADTERNPVRIHEALRILELHRQTWMELGTQLVRGQQAGGTAAAPTSSAVAATIAPAASTPSPRPTPVPSAPAIGVNTPATTGFSWSA